MIRKLQTLTYSLLFVFCSLFIVPCAFTQPPATWTSADMYLGIRKLNVLGSVLYVAAHPVMKIRG